MNRLLLLRKTFNNSLSPTGRRKWQPTPAFLPGEFCGRRSLVGCRLWGCTESDTTEATQQHQHHLQKKINLSIQYSNPSYAYLCDTYFGNKRLHIIPGIYYDAFLPLCLAHGFLLCKPFSLSHALISWLGRKIFIFQDAAWVT